MFDGASDSFKNLNGSLVVHVNWEVAYVHEGENDE